MANTNITAYNTSNSYQFNLTTDSTGYTQVTTIIDHINDVGSKTYYSNYTIYANHESYSNLNHSINITNLTNIYKDVFTFEESTGEIQLTTCATLDSANVLPTDICHPLK